MKQTHRIAMIPGDGIGPEVITEAVKVLRAAGDRHGVQFETTPFPFGANHWHRTRETLPDVAIEEMRRHDAILLGAVGDPTVPPGVLEQGILLRLRFALDLYINLRPVKLLPGVKSPLEGKTPEDIDFVIVRENTEDVYIGAGGFLHRGTANEVALQEVAQTRHGVERCVTYAFALAARRKRRLALCDKANVLTCAHDLWRRVFTEIGRLNPEIERTEVLVDAACLHFVTQPERFDVIVTTNMFGDILADLGAGISGGLGFAASANLHPGRVSLFEPVHGSAPDIAGQGKANPVAAILSTGLMLDALGHPDAGDAIRRAVERSIAEGRIDLRPGAMRTDEIGDRLAEAVA
jgi:3-isopropylmalate dehydrogenase